MNDYTIYCTAEQTRKALELGASIRTTTEHLYNHPHEYKYWVKVDIQGNFYVAKIPTAEQMISWLEEQGVLCDVFPTGDYGNDGFGMRIMKKAKRLNRFESDAIDYSSRREATLAAIDAALDYLTHTKK